MFAKIITRPATSLENKTGSWRMGKKPKYLHAKCTGCRLCFLTCPEGCISGSKKSYDVDLDYCKGCGLCAKVCPVQDIEMVPEK
jgi:pyruvate ferredoxin oxidoreductase delta subunit